mmetsp:Transcript_13530/g.38056  ORF Transcript_13530/g.38056 Transcript_13530/m.38056 type:complete len:243 (+) Transcript_13530:106-834(+)
MTSASTASGDGRFCFCFWLCSCCCSAFSFFFSFISSEVMVLPAVLPMTSKRFSRLLLPTFLGSLLSFFGCSLSSWSVDSFSSEAFTSAFSSVSASTFSSSSASSFISSFSLCSNLVVSKASTSSSVLDSASGNFSSCSFDVSFAFQSTIHLGLDFSDFESAASVSGSVFFTEDGGVKSDMGMGILGGVGGGTGSEASSSSRAVASTGALSLLETGGFKSGIAFRGGTAASFVSVSASVSSSL